MKSFITALLFFLALGATSSVASAEAPPIPANVQTLIDSSLSDTQTKLLLYAKDTATWSCGNPERDECKKLVRVAVGILWQESHAGDLRKVGDIKNGFGKRSYGVMQVKLDTARLMLSYDSALLREHFDNNLSDLTKEEIIAKLIEDDEFCIQVGIDNIQYLHDKNMLSWDDTVKAYNQGMAHRHNAKAKRYLAEYKTGVRTNPVAKVLTN